MKVTLISPYMDVSSIGTRLVAGSLKAAGHKVKQIFLTGGMEQKRGIDNSLVLNDEAMGQVTEICRGSDVIGVTLMTPHFKTSSALTMALKKSLKAPVIWGGVHPTLCPEESLEYADIACVGEGEEPIVDLLGRMEAGKDYFDTKNFWFKRNKKVISNPLRPLIRQLDSLPFPDYEISDQYAYDREAKRFRVMDNRLMAELMPLYVFRGRPCITYRTIATRGCPYGCTYCCNNIFKDLYPDEKKVRRRSNDNIISELVWIREKFPFVNAINFDDDCFLATSKENIADFAAKYKEKVGLPFYCLSSPTTISKEKLEVLIDAGLGAIQMGIESGSPHMLKLYGRPFSNEQVLNSAALINRYKDKVVPHYDIMFDAPYETEDDLIETLSLILKLPKPCHLGLFSVVLFPMTELFKMAKKDGLIKESEAYSKDYSDYGIRYMNFLFFLIGHSNLPKAVWKLLLNKKLLRLLDARPFHPFYRFMIVNVPRLLSRRREKRRAADREALFTEAMRAKGLPGEKTKGGRR